MKNFIALFVFSLSFQSFAQIIKPTPIPSSTPIPELHKDLVVFIKEQKMANAELKRELALVNQKLELLASSSPTKTITFMNGKKAQTTISADGARIILDNGQEYFVGAFSPEHAGQAGIDAFQFCQKRNLALSSRERSDIFMSYVNWPDREAKDWKALTNYDIVNQSVSLYISGSFYMYNYESNTVPRFFALCMR